MKIIHCLMAAASAVAITAAVGVITAGAASASTLEFHWYDDTYDTAMWANGLNNAVTLVPPTMGSLTNWTPTNGDVVDGIEFVEYQQVGTSRCLQYSVAAGGVVVEGTCTAGRASQLWYYSGNVSEGAADAGELVSLYNTQYCATAGTGYGVDGIILIKCDTTSIDTDQIWYTNL
jgi:hypothetical protein